MALLIAEPSILSIGLRFRLKLAGALTGRELAEHVREALVTEQVGRTLDLPGARCELAELFERARDQARLDCEVHRVWAPLHRLVRPIVRRVGREPGALLLAGKLRRLATNEPRARRERL